MRVVLDANVVTYGVLATDEHARRWVDAAAARTVDATAPDLLYAEVANALTVAAQADALAARDARAAIRFALRLPLKAVPVQTIAEEALQTALARNLTAYDACYAALAEASRATLVTADRRLAAAVPGATLPSEASPPS